METMFTLSDVFPNDTDTTEAILSYQKEYFNAANQASQTADSFIDFLREIYLEKNQK